jgi:hypothetical protein
MNATQPCPIWGIPAHYSAQSSNGDAKVASFRTDGEYRVTGTAISVLARTPPQEKARLTTWIVDQHRSGDIAPLVDDGVLEQVKTWKPLRYSQRRERFFLLALSRDFQPSSHFKIAGTVDDRQAQDTGAISAWTECQTDQDRTHFLRLLKEEGLVNFGGSDLVTLTSKGFEFLETLEFRGAETTQAFVAMWFDPSMEAAYQSGFERAITEAGYRPLRIDRKEHSNRIDDEIIGEIRRSRFVVADFTCGLIVHETRDVAVARGGVYYEAGFAQGLAIPVIWTCRAECIGHVHFDTRQYNHIVWNTPDELRERLYNRIRAVIG